MQDTEVTGKEPPGATKRLWRRFVAIARSLPVLILAGLFAVYLVFGFFLVNPLAQRLLPWIGEDMLASRLSAERVEFNPLTLETTVLGLQLAEPDGKPLAGFERLYVNLETTGLFRWAWRIAQIELDRPHGRIEIRPGGKLNWAALIASMGGASEEPPSDRMVRVLVDRLRIDNGDIEYIDANRRGEPFRMVLEPLGIELDGLSTLPEDRGDYLIAARLPEQGGTLKWTGDIALNPLASQGQLALEGVKLNNLLRVIKSPRNFELPSGVAAAGVHYRFAVVRRPSGEDAPWLRVDQAHLLVQDLTLAPRAGGAPVLRLAEARLADASFDLEAREVGVGSVSLTGGQAALTRNAQGTVDWQTLFAPAQMEAPAAEPATDRAAAADPTPPVVPWKIGVREIRLADWKASFTDEGYVRPLRVDAEGLTLTAALAGQIGKTAQIDLGPLNVKLGPVSVHSADESVGQLERAALINARLASPGNRVVIEALELSGARTGVELDRQRNLNWARILQRTAATGPAPASPASTESAALDLQLARLSVDGIEIGMVDRSTTRPVRLDLTQGSVVLTNLGSDLNSAVPLKAKFSLKQGGRFDASGSVTPAKPAGRLDIALSGLALKTFAPYVNQFARLSLHSGTATTRGRLAFEQAASRLRLDFGGRFAVDNLAITEEETGEAFLGWEKLSSERVQLKLGPNGLHMRELVALNPFGKVIIFEDQSLNLKRILRKPPGDAAPAEPAGSTAADAFPLVIERVRIVGGNAEFADLSLTPQFGTRMHGLTGVVTGLSTDPTATAQVELDGKVDEFGSARVRGTIQPFRATEHTDLKLAFRNLEMTRLTPYSAKFAGRRIDSGRLSVDLEYKIQRRQLAGDNKFIVNKLKLGERVDSPDAVNLPLDLAIALLQDSQGVIDLDLPVSGSLDDPQFSYGAIIWKAIVNVLTRLVTAPFRALGALLGIGAEQLEAVGFEPGSSALPPPEQEKLKAVAEALAKRPALTLTVEPGYDPAADRRALQEMTMRREAAAVAGTEVAAGEAAGPVDVNDYKIQTWLEDRYAEIAGKEAYQTLRAEFRDPDAGVVGRVMESQFLERLGRRFKTRDAGPPSAFHLELLERLTRQTEIRDEALIELARARGQAMREALLGRGLDERRIELGEPASREAADQLVASKLTLDAAREAAQEEKAAEVVPALEAAPAAGRP